MSRSKAMPRELVRNFVRLTSFLTRNRKREPFVRCLHQVFLPKFLSSDSAIHLGNPLGGYRATPYSAFSCVQSVKSFHQSSKQQQEKKNSPALRRLPDPFQSGWRGIFVPFFKSHLTSRLFGFLFTYCVILLFLCYLVTMQPLVMKSVN